MLLTRGEQSFVKERRRTVVTEKQTQKQPYSAGGLSSHLCAMWPCRGTDRMNEGRSSLLVFCPLPGGVAGQFLVFNTRLFDDK